VWQILHSSSFMVANSEPLDWALRLSETVSFFWVPFVCLFVLLFFVLFHFRFWFFVCSLVCLYVIEVWLFVWRVDILLNLQMVGHRRPVFYFFFFCWGCVNLVRKQIQCDSYKGFLWTNCITRSMLFY
jgi:hypothetical protein